MTSINNRDVAKRWFLVAAAAAWSDWHIDAAGFCTFIKMKKGLKIWVISHLEGEHPGSWSEDRNKLMKDKVDVIILGEGDLL